MFKKKIKLMTAMLAIVLIVAAVTSTTAKYVGEKSFVFDLTLEVKNGGSTHEAIRKVVDGKSLIENFISDTHCTELSYYYGASDNWIIKITTKRNFDKGDYNICLDPCVYLNLKDVEYTIDGKLYEGLSTDIIRYMVVSYYVPASPVPERAAYNSEGYSVNDFNHLRIYTKTTVNEGTSNSYGGVRFVKLSDSFSAADIPSGTGKWVTEIIDLQAVNMRGISYNDKQSSDYGIANWDGDLAGLRIDVGQVGGTDAWFSETSKYHDTPEGKSIYIRNIMFFNSYYRAARARVALASQNEKLDPTEYNYSSPVEINDELGLVPTGTLDYDKNYVYVDTYNSTEDTIADTFT